MKIEVLGTGCSGCRALYDATIRAVEESGLDATVVKQEEIEKIIEYGVMSLPALAVDGKVVSAGRRLTPAEVKDILSKLS